MNDQIVHVVRQYGGSTTDAILDPATLFFQETGIDGVIGYRAKDHTLIALGDPLSREPNKLSLAFHRFAAEKGLNVVTIAASKHYAHFLHETLGKAIVEFGEDLCFNCEKDPLKNTGTHGCLVRRKVRQAAKTGITVYEYQDESVEAQIEELAKAWVRSHKGKAHISNPHLFENRFGKRWFYASQGDRIQGVIQLNRLEKRKGWLINHLMVSIEAPNGISELIVTHVLEALRNEGCPYATVGIVAGKGLGEVRGFNALSKGVLRVVFRVIGFFLHLDRLNMFWGKFQPQGEPSYIALSHIKEFMSIKEVVK